ncbi:E1-like protein-activating [Coprinellus micaceus]|uniref:Ubiquitin-like modifier-activating enzyme ATG7 n=1 Tax=Coprinellus micaceus TaxID=71717 RepID=A0A4Y7SFD1_COPMI|nr:E1-like protein-activating [Coprinellus micaceus]
MPPLQFAPFSTLVSPAFWHKLTDLKIDVLKLSDDALPLTGSYTAGRGITDRETGAEVRVGVSKVTLGRGEEEGGARHAAGVTAVGSFKNFNTVEEFKALDKTRYFDEEAAKIWHSIHTTRSTTDLTRFFLITFADLKKYKYFYWFGFPAFVSKPNWEITEAGWQPVSTVLDLGQLDTISAHLRAQPTTPAFFLIKKAGDAVSVGRVEDYEEFFGVSATATATTEEHLIAFTDPSSSPTHPGWPLRNLLAYLRALHPAASSRVRVVRWRDADYVGGAGGGNGGYGHVASASGDPTPPKPGAVGWERNPQGKLGARVADLGPMMDPERLAAQAVDLNLKLMRWRILPGLDLERVKETRCLLLGAGTLGCYVARGLMGWGVRTITLLDSSTVSFSNPVRQPLFEFADCLDGGKPKAECAAAALKRVYPGINATGVNLSIPMPGHPVPKGQEAKVKEDVERLEKLFDEHDAVFLLMDSRESRWLPTVLGASKGKIVINAALGFDTFLVMRHGVRAKDVKGGAQRLGCYYCNDIVAPGDSLTDRTLDQMCTVTRPGLAPIASATAVELLTSLVQHPEGVHAPAPNPSTELAPTTSYAEQGGSVLGEVPHQIRGFLAQFRNLKLVGHGYDRCTGCAESVLEAYEKEGFDMLLKVFNDQKYLESLAGLDKLAEEGEAALEAVDWDEDGDGEDGDDF